MGELDFRTAILRAAEGEGGGGAPAAPGGDAGAGGAPSSIPAKADPAPSGDAAKPAGDQAKEEPLGGKTLLDGALGDGKAEPPANETPEEKATREAREAETPEQKATREAQEAEDAKKPKDVDGKPIPDTYADLKAPDGATLDPKLVEKYTPIFREAKFSPAQTQKALDVHSEIIGEMVSAHVEKVQGWAKDAKADKEFGGPKFDESVAKAHLAIKTFGNEALLGILDETGHGNHPEMIRFLARIGDAVGQNGSEQQNAGGKRVPISREAAFYPDMVNKV